MKTSFSEVERNRMQGIRFWRQKSSLVHIFCIRNLICSHSDCGMFLLFVKSIYHLVANTIETLI